MPRIFTDLNDDKRIDRVSPVGFLAFLPLFILIVVLFDSFLAIIFWSIIAYVLTQMMFASGIRGAVLSFRHNLQWSDRTPVIKDEDYIFDEHNIKPLSDRINKFKTANQSLDFVNRMHQSQQTVLEDELFATEEKPTRENS